jgi:hypothetical protein
MSYLPSAISASKLLFWEISNSNIRKELKFGYIKQSKILPVHAMEAN